MSGGLKPFRQDVRKKTPQIGQTPDMAPSSPSWVLLGASWPQSPANLAPTCHLGSILAFPGPAQNGQSGFQTQLGAKMAPGRPQDRPQTLPDPPGRRFFQVWGSIFLMFFSGVVRSGALQKDRPKRDWGRR